MTSLHEPEAPFEPAPADRAWWAWSCDVEEARDAAWERLHDLDALAAESEALDRVSGLGYLLNRHVMDALLRNSNLGHQP
jgi:hypothetical protein